MKGKKIVSMVVGSFLAFNVSVSVFAYSGVLKPQMNNKEVASLQMDLKELGFFPEEMECSGYYGEVTSQAVEKFQRYYGLAADGIAGKNTQEKVLEIFNSKNDIDMEVWQIIKLQQDLKKLGYFPSNIDCTGYYGEITVKAVEMFQEKNGLLVDGVAGKNTLAKIASLIGGTSNTTASTGTSSSSAVSTNTESTEIKANISRGDVSRDYMVSWFGNGENIFTKGTIATVYDINSGRTYNIKRTFGTNHADSETITLTDTNIMKQIYGGQWNWEKRPVVLIFGKYRIAASVAGMPHAGVDSVASLKTVSSRSGGYGRGTNLDEVKGNGMSGVFDVHLFKSRTHVTGKEDPKHQANVKIAATWLSNNSEKLEEIISKLANN